MPNVRLAGFESEATGCNLLFPVAARADPGATREKAETRKQQGRAAYFQSAQFVFRAAGFFIKGHENSTGTSMTCKGEGSTPPVLLDLMPFGR